MKTATKLVVTLELFIPQNYGKGNLAALEDLDVQFWAEDASEPTKTDWAIVQIS